MTAIIGGLWVDFTYLQDQRHQADALKAQADKDTQTRAIEARQPFTKVQLDTYIETAKVVGGLVSTNDWTAEEWKHNRQRFEELYWTELSMVEDTGVKEAMQAFRVQLQKAEANAGPPWKVPDGDFTELRERSYRLALALQASIEVIVADKSRPWRKLMSVRIRPASSPRSGTRSHARRECRAAGLEGLPQAARRSARSRARQRAPVARAGRARR